MVRKFTYFILLSALMSIFFIGCSIPKSNVFVEKIPQELIDNTSEVSTMEIDGEIQ